MRSMVEGDQPKLPLHHLLAQMVPLPMSLRLTGRNYPSISFGSLRPTPIDARALSPSELVTG